MKRYNQLLQLIDLYRPQTIVETGVWNGHNAVRMIQAAAKHQSVIYHGYDLFEDGSAELDAKEFNVKHHNTINSVYATIKPTVGDAHEVRLIRGNTNETLAEHRADLAFIDGGHSIETIANDYQRLRGSQIIVLDDYYTPDESGNGPDTSLYGCNQLVDSLPNAVLLPLKDPVKGGGFTQFAMVVGG